MAIEKDEFRSEEWDEEDRYLVPALRITGEGIPFETINSHLGVQPTSIHRKGERRPRSIGRWVYPEDGWEFRPTIRETEPLDAKFRALRAIVSPCANYLKSLDDRFRVEITCLCLTYGRDADRARSRLRQEYSKHFSPLDFPLRVSVMFLSKPE